MGKYALLLHGSMRSYKSAYKYLYDNLLSINDVDIFISTNKSISISSNIEKDMNPKPFENIYGTNLKSISYIEDIDQTYLIDLLKKKIKIIDCDFYNLHTDEIEKITNLNEWYYFYNKNRNENGFYFTNKENFTYVLHEIIMLYHRYNAYLELEKYSKTNNILYKGVILYRPDLFFRIPLILDNFIFKDEVLYFRLEFFFITTYNSTKKLVTNLLQEFYLLNNKINEKNTYLSETQHMIFLYTNFKFCFNTLNPLYHYRSINEEISIPLSCSEILEENALINFYNHIKILNNKVLSS